MRVHWHRSLYWRIAIGFVLALAAMLVVQAVLFVWVVSRTGPTLPGQPPDRFAQTVALDLAQQIARDPDEDIGRYLAGQYGRDAHPFFVLMADGRMYANGGPFPEAMMREAQAGLARGPEEFARGPRRRQDFAGPPPGIGRGPGFPPIRPTPVIVNDRLAGVVVVLPVAPFGFLLGRYAPTLALVASGALLVGAALAAVTIFGPARRRLRAVEEAARRLGNGDLSARAPAHGGDEVAAVAQAFNAMASDLGERAHALAASDQARRQLLADVSHELNTPVTAMRGYLETLTMADFPIDDARRARYLSIVGEETARLERIIGDLLDLARLEGGGGALQIDDVPTAQLFDRVIARHERASSEAGVHIVASVEHGAETVRADRDRLEQALQNLAANALRYAPRGSTIELGARNTTDGVSVTVSDRGPGIAPEHLPRVFDRFYKTDASRAGQDGASGGSGLGLSIVKAIVERHGGTVSVQSASGKTVFTILIGG